MKNFLILFEHATGYALFNVIANDEIGALLPHVQECVGQLDRFGKVVKLLAFSPFVNAQQSLDNALTICEGAVHDDLKEFIIANVSSKKDKVKLGVNEPKLAASLQEAIGIKCEYGETIAEITRGIRLHFVKMVEGVTNKVSETAQLGLGHSFSRSKVKFNANKSDNMIIQSIALLEQLDKDINTFSMRIREWYSYHFPELYKLLNDNYKFTRLVLLIGDRNQFVVSDHIEEFNDIVGDENIAQEIISTIRVSMGTDISDIDLLNIKSFASRVISLYDYRQNLSKYLSKKMNRIAPNLTAVIGENVGAKLISQAGSLVNLAKCPASTLQILGAEKALFRAIKTRGRTPKYGLIYHSSFISRAPLVYKGRVSRLLAHKCSIASRMDYFQEKPNNIIGKCLYDQIEERLRYMQNSNKSSSLPKPKSNIDIMRDALEKSESYANEKTAKREKRKAKKLMEKNESSIMLAGDTSSNLDYSNTNHSENPSEVVSGSGKKSRKRNKTITC